MSVTITNGATVLTLVYTPEVMNEPTQAKVSRALTWTLSGGAIVTEYTWDRVRKTLRLHLPYLTKANADTLLALLGMTGLVTIALKKEFPTTATNPTSYQGVWADDGRQVFPRPVLASALPRTESGTWDAVPSDMQVYEAEVELAVMRVDET